MYYLTMSVSDFEKACLDGDIDTVHVLIKKYVSNKKMMKHIPDYWNYGLVAACQGGHLEIVDLMIKHGAYNWVCGLKSACEMGHLNIVNLMIEYGVDDWNEGLESACKGGHIDVVKLMIEKGAKRWNIGLYHACMNGHLNIVKLLIKRETNDWNGALRAACGGWYRTLHPQNKWKYRALPKTHGERHSDIAKLMIEHGADDLTFMFHYAFSMIDSDIVNLIIRRQILNVHVISYSEDQIKIFRLLELGLPINNLKNLVDFDNLIKDIEDRRNTVRHVLFDPLIDNLREIVAGYVTN